MRGAWCALGLGSNLGDRAQMIQRAWDALGALPILTELRRAPLYESAPVDCPDGSPAFVNTVVTGALDGEPEDLLASVLAIEKQLGRTRTGAFHEARVVDIDILLIEGCTLETDSLVVPHPHLEERLFVLQPLANLEPALILPSGETISAAIQRLQGTQPIQPFTDH